MEFNQIILEKLHALFTDHGLKMTESSNHIVKYESPGLVITLIHDPVENSNVIWIGRNEINQNMLDGNIIKKFFTPDLEKVFKIPEKTVEDFANNVLNFFIGDGKNLLEGNELVLVSLEKFNELRNLEYTVSLVEQQNLEAANKAWKDGNYTDVIKYLNRVNKDNLSASFKLKYKIAQQKLNN